MGRGTAGGRSGGHGWDVWFTGVAQRVESLRSMIPRGQRNRFRIYKDVAPDFFAAAQRAFASVDSFFRAVGLIGFRAVGFLAGAAAFLGAGLPFCFAQRAF